MFPADRGRLRDFYADAWARFQAGEALQPLQALVVEVMREHPEYLGAVTDAGRRDQDYGVEAGGTNPFLHLGMHVALREQHATDRPAGLRHAYDALVRQRGDRHAAEHDMMECLGQVMWEAQRRGQAADEMAFLECLRGLLRRTVLHR